MKITGFVWWSSRLKRRFWFNSCYLKSEKKNFEKDVITVQLLFACLYHMKYNSFLSFADLQQILFCFPCDGWQISCLFRCASFLKWSLCKVSILCDTCFKNMDLHGFMLLQSKCSTLYGGIIFYVNNSNAVTVAIEVAILRPKLLRYFFFQIVNEICIQSGVSALSTPFFGYNNF